MERDFVRLRKMFRAFTARNVGVNNEIYTTLSDHQTSKSYPEFSQHSWLEIKLTRHIYTVKIDVTNKIILTVISQWSIYIPNSYLIILDLCKNFKSNLM